jgi:hypothetical protein
MHLMRILFWNVRHLGEGTDEARKAAITRVSQSLKPDYTIFCELVTTSTYPPAINLSHRMTNPYQLCYGCMDAAGTFGTITRADPLPTDEYMEAGFKGGNDFSELADRALGYVGELGGAHVYVLHAPSGSGSAQKAVSFVACWLHGQYGADTPWILIGDLNVEPEKLEASGVGIELEDYIIDPGVPTYIGRKKDKKFDYALANFDAAVGRARVSPRFHGSDHYPIYVQWDPAAGPSTERA